MNRITAKPSGLRDPALFSAAFAACGKTSRRSHDRAGGAAPLHPVSAFATNSRLVLGQEAVADKAGEAAAIPMLLAPAANASRFGELAENGGLRGALAAIDAIATNAAVATAIQDAGADDLPAVKANQPTLRSEVEACFAAALLRSQGHGHSPPLRAQPRPRRQG